MEKQLQELRAAMDKESKPVIASTQSIALPLRSGKGAGEAAFDCTESVVGEKQEIPMWLCQNRLRHGQI
jgi:hypothetical protein